MPVPLFIGVGEVFESAAPEASDKVPTGRLYDYWASCKSALAQLGDLRVSILTGSMAEYTETIARISNADIEGIDDFEEVRGFTIDEYAFEGFESASDVSGGLGEALRECESIRRRAYELYALLVRLDARFTPAVRKLDDIVDSEGCDYQAYTAEQKEAVAQCATIAATVKTVLDTPLLAEDGTLTPESALLLA